MVVYTVLLADYDALQPALFSDRVQYVCFSDAPVEARGWKYVHLDRQLGDAGRDSRYPKIRPDLFLPDFQISLYHDANRQLQEDPIAFCEKWLHETNLAFFRHDSVDCLYDAAKLCKKYRLDTDAKFDEQVQRYEAQGLPPHWGLLFGGIILRRHVESDVVEFSELWWAEYCRGSCRDQISLPYALWKTGIRYTVIPGNTYKISSFSRQRHKRGRRKV